MAANYHTQYNSQTNILLEKGLTDYKEAIEMAYQILLRQVCKNKDDVVNTITKLKTGGDGEQNSSHNRYRIQLDLTEQRDFIVLTTIDSKRHEFSRAKFLDKRRIKNDLINYYKPLGLFVKPPQKQPNSNIWYIDLLFRTENTLEMTTPSFQASQMMGSQEQGGGTSDNIWGKVVEGGDDAPPKEEDVDASMDDMVDVEVGEGCAEKECCAGGGDEKWK